MAGWLAPGWLVGLLFSRIECLKKRMRKSARFCTSGNNFVLNVIQNRFGALAGWLAVAGCLAGRLPGCGWIEKACNPNAFFNKNAP